MLTLPADHRRRTGFTTLILTLSVLGGVLTTKVYAAAIHVVADADTSVTIAAGDSVPQLKSLSLRGVATWLNQVSDPLPDRVELETGARRVKWRLDSTASTVRPTDVELVYVADSPRLELVWAWRARAGRGPLEHTVTIRNLGTESLWLPLVPSLRFNWQTDPHTALARFWVEKGGGAPSEYGTHADTFADGDTWQGTSSTYARPFPDKPNEMIPYVLVHQRDADRRGWFIGLEFSGRTHITLKRDGDSVLGEAGLDPEPGPYRTRLLPGASFVTPSVFLGGSTGGPDGAGNRLRRWVRAALNNPLTLQDPSYPLMVSNSFGSGMAVDESLARRMIVAAQELGLEMYHLDAGWFRAVGDWESDPVKFPHSVAAVADYAHDHGLKFGLWIDWTQAGVSTRPGALNITDPVVRSWLVADPPPAWKPDPAAQFKGITMDLGVPAVQAWASQELESLVRDSHLDMLEHDGYLIAQGTSRSDHPAAPPAVGTLREYQDAGYLWADSSNSTDVSYHATRAYYAIYEELRRRHPHLLFEVCNDGGRMVDFGSAAHGDYFSITDIYDPLSNRRAFFDTSYVLPSAMLESYVEKWPTPTAGNFRYMLRSGMMGWFSLMLDSSLWTTEQRQIARTEFALYKRALRPLIREADLYHVSSRPDGVHWDGIEYYSQSQKGGVLYAFRGTVSDESSHHFVLQGLEPQRRYRLHFQDQGPAHDVVVSGDALARDGVQVVLPDPLSSELVFFTALPTAVHPTS